MAPLPPVADASTVFQLDRDENTVSFFSYLHEWAANHADTDADEEPNTNGPDALKLTNLKGSVNIQFE